MFVSLLSILVHAATDELDDMCFWMSKMFKPLTIINNLRKQFHCCKGQEVQNVNWLHARLHNLKGALCTSVGLDKHCVCLHYNNKSLQYHQYPWKLPNLVNFGFLAYTVNILQMLVLTWYRSVVRLQTKEHPFAWTFLPDQYENATSSAWYPVF